MDCRGGGSCWGASQRRSDEIHLAQRRPSMDLILTQTPQQIRAFQREHRDWNGKALVVDGDVGPRTAWAWAVSELEPRRRRAVRRVCNWVGLVEQPGNRGKPVDDWVSRCGVELGSPWCAAFASYGLSVDGAEPVAIAGAVNLGRRYPAVLPGAPVQAGDLVWFPTDTQGHGHCGLAISGVWEHPDHPGLEVLATVEGNLGNRVQAVYRIRSEVHVSRPFAGELGAIVPLPTELELVHAHWNGTR